VILSSKMHKKHTKLIRPDLGLYARSELALVGTNCDTVQKLSERFARNLSDTYNVSYVDADHGSFDHQEERRYLQDGASLYMLDKQNALELNRQHELSKYDRHSVFDQQDFVVVNGNHFEASHQMVFLDSKKTKSLEKRISQLTNVIAFIRVDLDTPSEEVQKALNDWSHIPMLSIYEPDALVNFVKNWLEARKPPLKALILAGGKSSRMGRDKSHIKYHTDDQALEIANLAKPLVEEVYISCRKDQQFDYPYPRLEDTIDGLGPMGAILSAMRHDPNAAWLVLACDLPFLDSDTLKYLIDNRSQKHIATAYNNEETGFAEPLVSIWEPKSYSRLLQFLATGYSCPRKVLINSDTRLITPVDSDKLSNVNTPEEYERAILKIKGS